MAKATQLFIVGPVSLRSALARYADLWAPAHKACFPALAASASDEKEAARLQHLASPEGKAEFSDWVGGPRRSLLEVLLAFPSCKPSLGVATTQYAADRPQMWRQHLMARARMHACLTDPWVHEGRAVRQVIAAIMRQALRFLLKAVQMDTTTCA